ncbi:hypothetical protein [Winogradskyella aurantia]|uniref:Lipoprotein n=1 Tax=Winogradskyella aurantia TaxID=1915063 RepID=A0A265US91_9FLAO|nr:hypothetical protein [Winogradskyella aurantia]OZV68175.1 hypothetical protein CA834_11050 [Winogradskyella aurantia]
MKLNNSLLILMIIGFLGCKQKPSEEKIVEVKNPKVVNFDNKLAFNEFSKLNLDDKCVNLLDPTNTSEAERKSVINSWSNFHKNVTRFLKEEKFDWEVADSTISIYNRIYFDKNGNINYYVFNINNPSITEEKKAEFENVLLKFSKDVQLDLQRNQAFSQCGKTTYVNY